MPTGTQGLLVQDNNVATTSDVETSTNRRMLANTGVKATKYLVSIVVLMCLVGCAFIGFSRKEDETIS